MAQAQLGADVASAGELNASLLSGIPSEKIEFSGPGKTEEELALAIDRQIGSINAESLEELKKIRLVAARREKIFRLGLQLLVRVRLIPRLGLRMLCLRAGPLLGARILRGLCRHTDGKGRQRVLGLRAHLTLHWFILRQ